MVQTCIVHLIRAASRWVAYGDRWAGSAALKKIYTATDEPTAQAALDECDALNWEKSIHAQSRSGGMLGSVSYRFCSSHQQPGS
ncbi:transposase [Corynebacterium pseudodiphtheriticum]|nr:transposase [Corynebacterium pseudodiphtheriticum]MDK8552546.1 transposase [Corynebacterium pseudodiphtheriticum]MDK8563751.1 transposase [Corynebacterium pseudodiphtheriticum]